MSNTVKSSVELGSKEWAVGQLEANFTFRQMKDSAPHRLPRYPLAKHNIRSTSSPASASQIAHLLRVQAECAGLPQLDVTPPLSPIALLLGNLPWIKQVELDSPVRRWARQVFGRGSRRPSWLSGG